MLIKIVTDDGSTHTVNMKLEDFEDKALLNELLSPDEIKILFDKLRFWIGRI
jgi:hypothetical protein